MVVLPALIINKITSTAILYGIILYVMLYHWEMKKMLNK
ncbi:hypothetical protein BAT_3186 [Bacillus pumilus ATCC 7061]|nr:hypothetical protein BAT_3186 [Bacillus pumilus ATCC 7061]